MQHKLNSLQQNLLTEFCERWEVKLSKDYSGRGMMGKTCVGLIISQFVSPFMIGMKLGQFLALNPDPADDLLELIEGNSTDSLGKGTILYFPTLTWQ